VSGRPFFKKSGRGIADGIPHSTFYAALYVPGLICCGKECGQSSSGLESRFQSGAIKLSLAAAAIHNCRQRPRDSYALSFTLST
jgi:hypothetical protein